MSATLVDSNVLIDILTKNSQFAVWSFRQISRLGPMGDLIVNQICFAETAVYFLNLEAFDRAMSLISIEREDLPWSAAGKAGNVHREYRQQGGPRERVLPDFLIGAHATERGYRLLTRDPARYRTYFPALDIIAPDTHP
jgi:predicted nucleic acid-binding protein